MTRAPELVGPLLAVWKQLRTVDGFVEGPSVFDDSDQDRAFYVNGTQVVNLRGPGVLELRVTKAVIRAERARLKADPRVELRPSTSDWLRINVSKARDASLVLDLARRAAEAHLPPRGTTVRPPPDGADLARRRRFH